MGSGGLMHVAWLNMGGLDTSQSVTGLDMSRSNLAQVIPVNLTQLIYIYIYFVCMCVCALSFMFFFFLNPLLSSSL